MQQMYRAMLGSPVTVLSSSLDSRESTINVADVLALPTAPNVAVIFADGGVSEVIRYSGISGSTLTGVTRGFNGTTAQNWPSGTNISRPVTSYDHDAFLANINTMAASIEELRALLNEIELEFGQDGVNNPHSAAVEAVIERIKALEDKLKDVEISDSGPLNPHVLDRNNPHSTTAAQIGLNNVNNTSDADKPISSATSSALTNLDNNKVNRAGDTMTGALGVPTIFNVNASGEQATWTGNHLIATLSGAPSPMIFSAEDLIMHRPGTSINNIWDSFNLPVESGVWIPTVIGVFGHGEFSATINYGTWHRIGDLVTLSFWISGNLSNANGPVAISNLPFINVQQATLVPTPSAVYNVTGGLKSDLSVIIYTFGVHLLFLDEWNSSTGERPYVWTDQGSMNLSLSGQISYVI